MKNSDSNRDYETLQTHSKYPFINSIHLQANVFEFFFHLYFICQKYSILQKYSLIKRSVSKQTLIVLLAAVMSLFLEY